MTDKTQEELTKYLRSFATEARWDKIVEVASRRTRHIAVVLEDIYQPHNASAVLRSCDGFGIQDVYIIENWNTFDASSQVTIGSDQWLTLRRFREKEEDNTGRCFKELRKRGYRIIATSPHETDTNLNDLPITEKTALVFGSEVDGISDRTKEMADGFLKIPMEGFSESFNISVSAAICLYNISRRLRNSDIPWQLSPGELSQLKLEWLKKSIKASDELERKFLEDADNK